ncbi:amidohydrolase family protein [Eubacteriaceae bacterium ES3]|nr:amidohydrolase family protein [Eubacteriaceae bacterium ES3]
MRMIMDAKWLLATDGLKKNWSILIEDGIIMGIGPTRDFEKEPCDERLQFEDRMLMPGFVNGHNHMYGFLSHGIHVASIVEDFSDFLEDYWWPYIENRVDHAEVTATTKMACLEMIESGVTSFVDVLEAPMAKPGVLELEKSIIEASGLRGRLSIEACERISAENGIGWLEENLRFIEKASETQGLVDGIMSIHTLFTCSDEFVIRAKEMAKSIGTTIHMHLSESDYEPEWCLKNRNEKPVDIYEGHNYLDESVLASQVVQVSDQELDILAKRQVRAVSMPLSNCEVGGGFAPLTKMLERGMTVGLGTDGYINNFFEVMRGAFLMHKANQKNPQVMSAETVYKMATEMGAEAIGKPQAGKLAPGAYADIISVSLDLPTPITDHNVYEQIVLFMNPQNVMDVMVDGKWLKRNGKLLTINAVEVKEEMRSAAQGFWSVNTEE